MVTFKSINENSIHMFWNWFCINQEAIKDSVNRSRENPDNMNYWLDTVETQLKKVFNKYHGNIEFEYGYNGKTWDFVIYHLNNSYLTKAIKKIEALMPKAIQTNWNFLTSK